MNDNNDIVEIERIVHDKNKVQKVKAAPYSKPSGGGGGGGGGTRKIKIRSLKKE